MKLFFTGSASSLRIKEPESIWQPSQSDTHTGTPKGKMSTDADDSECLSLVGMGFLSKGYILFAICLKPRSDQRFILQRDGFRTSQGAV